MGRILSKIFKKKDLYQKTFGALVEYLVCKFNYDRNTAEIKAFVILRDIGKEKCVRKSKP